MSTKTNSKKVILELKEEALKLFKDVKSKSPKKTQDILFDLNDKLPHKATLNKIIKELNIIQDLTTNTLSYANKANKKDIDLYKQKSVKITEKINKVAVDRNREIKKYERKGLGNTFREMKIYAQDIDGLEGFNFQIGADNNESNLIISNILSAQIRKDLINLQKINKRKSLKSYITIKSELFKIENRKEVYKSHFFNSEIRDIMSLNNIRSFVNDAIHKFYEDLTIAKDGSEWRFKKFIYFSIKSNIFNNALGKSYIPLPKAILDKKACINPKNLDDEMCFDYCLLIHKFYDEIKSKDKNELYHYKKRWDEIIRPENVTYPISTNMIEEYEKLNNLQINVFELIDYDETKDAKDCISYLYITNQFRKDVVNIMLITDGENSHYVVVKNLSRLFASKTTHDKKFICPNCLVKFATQDRLNLHRSKETCKPTDIECIMPDTTNNIMQFKNEQNSFKHPFHIIADFESTLLKQEIVDTTLSTQKYQKHVPNSFGLKFCSIHKDYEEDVKIVNNSDPELVCKQFIETLEMYAKKSYDLIKLKSKPTDIIMSAKEEREHNYCKKCLNCSHVFDKENKLDIIMRIYKVRHHDHITGKFISTLCNKCNLKFQYKPFLPVYLHNLKGYDSHLFVNALNKYGQIDDCEISCIPNNEEKYISFSKNIKVGTYINAEGIEKPVSFEIRFLDTIAFMNSSIDSLVNNLSKGKNDILALRMAFPNTSKHFTDDEQFKMMTTKGIYPYDYIDSYDRLNDLELPDQKEFYSRLYDSKCSDFDYEKARNVWKVFKCKTLLDYHNYYLKSDVLLLADVWESFRNVCYLNYGLDCTYYYTSPGLSFDAMLKHTKQKLELFTDQEMYEFCEKGIRGGLSQISTRHAVANNKYMSNYNATSNITTEYKVNKMDVNKKVKMMDGSSKLIKDLILGDVIIDNDNKASKIMKIEANTIGDSYIIYLDANNLYGWAMSQALPVGKFKWNTDEWNTEKILEIGVADPTGYLFEVDLHIPESLHDHFNNYVPCPENISIDKNDLNTWQQIDYKESKIEKLCTSFKDKVKYVVNYRYLQLVLKLGLELKAVHRVLEFEQKDFLKSYIQLNTNLRTKATKAKNDFEKDFFKLMNNSVFGKTMENVRCRINFRLISTEEESLRVKNLKRFTLFSENLVGVHIQKTKIGLNKPVYLGQTILDDSKFLMYDFHYNFMLQKIPRSDIDLLFTDTDSLCYHIRKHDIFQIMKENKEHFDLSEYPEDSEFYDPTNTKVIGKFKNESIQQITEFIGLRAKLYAYSVDQSNKKNIKCKGVKTSVAKRDLNVDMYRSVLYNRDKVNVTQNGIRSYGHQIYTESVNKTALSGNDDKVFICDDNVGTYNFGHYKTKTN